MSTEIFVRVPKPNHQRVRVQVQGRHSDGTWGTEPHYDINQGDEVRFLVYASQRLLIEEIE